MVQYSTNYDDSNTVDLRLKIDYSKIVSLVYKILKKLVQYSRRYDDSITVD